MISRIPKTGKIGGTKNSRNVNYKKVQRMKVHSRKNQEQTVLTNETIQDIQNLGEIGGGDFKEQMKDHLSKVSNIAPPIEVNDLTPPSFLSRGLQYFGEYITGATEERVEKWMNKVIKLKNNLDAEKENFVNELNRCNQDIETILAEYTETTEAELHQAIKETSSVLKATAETYKENFSAINSKYLKNRWLKTFEKLERKPSKELIEESKMLIKNYVEARKEFSSLIQAERNSYTQKKENWLIRFDELKTLYNSTQDPSNILALGTGNKKNQYPEINDTDKVFEGPGAQSNLAIYEKLFGFSPEQIEEIGEDIKKFLDNSDIIDNGDDTITMYTHSRGGDAVPLNLNDTIKQKIDLVIHDYKKGSWDLYEPQADFSKFKSVTIILAVDNAWEKFKIMKNPSIKIASNSKVILVDGGHKGVSRNMKAVHQLFKDKSGDCYTYFRDFEEVDGGSMSDQEYGSTLILYKESRSIMPFSERQKIMQRYNISSEDLEKNDIETDKVFDDIERLFNNIELANKWKKNASIIKSMINLLIQLKDYIGQNSITLDHLKAIYDAGKIPALIESIFNNYEKAKKASKEERWEDAYKHSQEIKSNYIELIAIISALLFLSKKLTEIQELFEKNDEMLAQVDHIIKQLNTMEGSLDEKLRKEIEKKATTLAKIEAYSNNFLLRLKNLFEEALKTIGLIPETTLKEIMRDSEKIDANIESISFNLEVVYSAKNKIKEILSNLDNKIIEAEKVEALKNKSLEKQELVSNSLETLAECLLGMHYIKSAILDFMSKNVFSKIDIINPKEEIKIIDNAKSELQLIIPEAMENMISLDEHNDL
jgi:hypothetical protein